MNFREAMNPELTSLQYLDIPHEERYGAIVKAIGYEDVKKCIPFSIEQLKEAYEGDKHFNNLPMKKWDLAGGFTGWPSRADYVGSTLTRLYGRIGVDTFSCSDGVCILKCCARMWIEEEGTK